MKAKWMLLVLGVVLLSLLAAGADHPQPATPVSHDVSMDMVAKIKVGSTTGAQVTSLLGAPWRSVNYGDCGPQDYQNVWEYVGHDASGAFRIHIELDDDLIARIVAKVPQQGPITVLASAPRPEKKHQH